MFLQGIERMPHQLITNTLAFYGAGHADLRDVSDVGVHQAAESKTAQSAGGGIKRNEGRGLEKAPAAGVLHNVEQKSPRSAGGAVLVVDFTVDVTAIGFGDQRGSLILTAFGPVVDQYLGGL